MLSPTPPECGEGCPGRRGERLEPKARDRHISGCRQRVVTFRIALHLPSRSRQDTVCAHRYNPLTLAPLTSVGRYRTIHIPNGIVYKASAGVQLQKCKMTLAVAKSCGPGRPKDLEKRAAILAAAKRLFPLFGIRRHQHGRDRRGSRRIQAHRLQPLHGQGNAVRRGDPCALPGSGAGRSVRRRHRADRCAASSKRSRARSSDSSPAPKRSRCIAC